MIRVLKTVIIETENLIEATAYHVDGFVTKMTAEFHLDEWQPVSTPSQAHFISASHAADEHIGTLYTEDDTYELYENVPSTLVHAAA